MQEQLKKMEGIQDLEEFMKFAADEGIELTDEQIEAVSGGGDFLAEAAQSALYPF